MNGDIITWEAPTYRELLMEYYETLTGDIDFWKGFRLGVTINFIIPKLLADFLIMENYFVSSKFMIEFYNYVHYTPPKFWVVLADFIFWFLILASLWYKVE